MTNNCHIPEISEVTMLSQIISMGIIRDYMEVFDTVIENMHAYN